MQMSTKVYMGGGGVQKVQKLVYVVYGWHLSTWNEIQENQNTLMAEQYSSSLYHMIIKEFFKIHFLKNYSCISYQATLLYDFLQQYECKIRDKEPSRIYNQYTGS